MNEPLTPASLAAMSLHDLVATYQTARAATRDLDTTPDADGSAWRLALVVADELTWRLRRDTSEPEHRRHLRAALGQG